MSRPVRSFLSFLLVLQLILPYSTFAAAVGEFSSVVGDVTQTRARAVIKPVVKSPVELKDIIATARTSTATMVFSDESTITLSENTKLEIKEFLFKDKSRTGIFSLAIGKLTANVKKYIGGENVFEVHSPTVAVGARGTGFEFTEAMKDGKVDSNATNQRMATVACTEGSLNLSALSATGEVVSTAVLEAGQVAVIIGGVITISMIGAAAAAASRATDTGTAGATGGSGTGTGGTAAAGGGATTTAASSGTTVAAGSASGGAATVGTAVAATGLSTAAITGMAIGGAAVVGVAAAAAGGSGGGDSSSSTPCSNADGRWGGMWSGTACGVSESGTWVMNCSRCSCPGTVWSSNIGSHSGNCNVSGNSVSCAMNGISCLGNTTTCTVNASGTISGNSVSGTYSGCDGIMGNWTGSKQ